MARIPEDMVKEIKSQTLLENLVKDSGVDLKRQGKDLIGLCPFHDDKEPSLVISPSKNLWNCLGACKQGGSVIDWVMKAEGISFRHALELLREGYQGTKLEGKSIRHGTTQKLESVINPEASESESLSQVIDFYHQALLKTPQALKYLEKRGLNNPELINHFKLGFSDRTLGYHIPKKNRKDGKIIRGKLQSLGILKSNGHEHFRGSLVIPVSDEQGQVSEVYGRKLAKPKDGPSHLYLPGPHRGVFNLAAFKDTEEIILCESLIDALTFWNAGFHNVTASYGIQGFTKDHRKAFKNNGIKTVFIAYDRDQAGNSAAKDMAEEFFVNGLEAWRVEFPKGMDANEYATKMSPADKSLGLVLRQAKWMGKGPSSRLKPVKASESKPPEEVKPKEEIKEPSPIPSLAAPIKEEPVSNPKPTPKKTEVQSKDNDDLEIMIGDRRYRIRGLAKNMSFEQLRINLLAGRGEAFFIDTFDLYSARPRSHFIKEAALELSVDQEVIKRDLGKILLSLEEIQEQNINEALEPKNQAPEISEEERDKALNFLRDPRLMERILSDFNACGVIGEESNKLLGYLATVSRKLDGPLAVIIQSSSAAGKSSLMEAILAFMPPEERVKYSALTGQSLFYMGEEIDLRHKVLAIVEEEGAQKASYALKLLQSEGELTIASTGKDPVSGRLTTQEYSVEGPVMLMLTTTAIEIDEELLNRCIVLSVSEDREQTKAIHKAQRTRRTLSGLKAKRGKEAILNLHRNAQRLLQPLAVVNPYAEHLTFLDDRTRMRRDHEKYLTLIEAIALIHQKQRPIKTETIDGEDYEYIEVMPSDIALANTLADEVLGQSLDEMPPQTRLFLEKLEVLVLKLAAEQEIEAADVRFTRRDIREFTGISYEQVRVHLERLVDLEYVLSHRSGRGQSFFYELLYDGRGKDGRPFVMGLLNVSELDGTTIQGLGGQNLCLPGQTGSLPEGCRGDTGAIPGPYRTGYLAAKPDNKRDRLKSVVSLGEADLLRGVKEAPIINAKVSRNGVSLGGQ